MSLIAKRLRLSTSSGVRRMGSHAHGEHLPPRGVKVSAVATTEHIEGLGAHRDRLANHWRPTLKDIRSLLLWTVGFTFGTMQLVTWEMKHNDKLRGGYKEKFVGDMTPDS